MDLRLVVALPKILKHKKKKKKKQLKNLVMWTPKQKCFANCLLGSRGLIASACLEPSLKWLIRRRSSQWFSDWSAPEHLTAVLPMSVLAPHADGEQVVGDDDVNVLTVSSFSRIPQSAAKRALPRIWNFTCGLWFSRAFPADLKLRSGLSAAGALN